MDPMMRVMLAQASGGGGGGGCGVALTTPYDDNFDCGSSVDTAGTRFSGAYPWTDALSSPYTGATQSGGQLVMGIGSAGGYFLYGPYQAIQSADLSADWTFETVCARDTGGGFAPMAGLALIESATGKELHMGFADVFAKQFVVGDAAGMGTYASIGLGTIYGGKIEVARSSGNFRVRYDIGSGWVIAVASLAQTTPFTVRPDRIQCINAPRRDAGSTGTTHDYFHKTA